MLALRSEDSLSAGQLFKVVATRFKCLYIYTHTYVYAPPPTHVYMTFPLLTMRSEDSLSAGQLFKVVATYLSERISELSGRMRAAVVKGQVCVYTYACLYMYVSTSISIYAYTPPRWSCWDACAPLSSRARNMYMHLYVYTYLYIYIYLNVYIDIYRYLNIYIGFTSASASRSCRAACLLLSSRARYVLFITYICVFTSTYLYIYIYLCISI